MHEWLSTRVRARVRTLLVRAHSVRGRAHWTGQGLRGDGAGVAELCGREYQSLRRWRAWMGPGCGCAGP
jgi:hypothetical protein